MTPERMREVLDFLAALDKNNCREWFDLHRQEWLKIKGYIAAFAEELIEGIASFDSSVRGVRVQDCTYRIARDTRFSTDKSPYKNWLGIYVAPRGKKSGYAGYYFHVSPAGDRLVGHHLVCAGLYCPSPEVLRSCRDDIIDNGAEWRKVIAAAEGYHLDEASMLKRTPKGFPTDSEYDDLLRHKDFDLMHYVDEDFLLAPNLTERVLEEFRKLEPFVTLLNRSVQYAYDEM